MSTLVSILNARITQPDYQVFQTAISSALPSDEYQALGGWNSYQQLGVEEEGSDLLGIGQIVIHGPRQMLDGVLSHIQDVCQEYGAKFMQHPQDQFQGEAKTAAGDPVWIEGLAAGIFGGNVFDLAFAGNPACLMFLRRIIPFAGPDAVELIQQSVEDPAVREQARQALEKESQISFADHLLYYGKDAQGLGHVYSGLELDLAAV